MSAITQPNPILWGLPLPILTVFITIATFSLGIVITQCINAWSKYIVRKTNREIIRLNHKTLIEEAEKQRLLIVEDIKQMRIEHLGDYVLNYRSTYSLEVFKEIGYQNLHKAYLSGFLRSSIKKRNTHLLHILSSTIERASNSYRDLRLVFEVNMAEMRKLDAARYITMQKAQDLIEDYNLKISGKVRDNEHRGIFLLRRTVITKRWLNQQDFRAPYKANIYLDDMIVLNREYMQILQDYESDIRFVELNSLINQTTGTFLNMSKLLDSTRHQFEHFAKAFGEMNLSLNETYIELNSKKTKLVY